MNRLKDQTSPYLSQHADNPVNWHPWDEEAWKTARETDKPVLLSIGYSACHWCHVMAHESFEDPDTARVMNENFVNIKVDREERPDLDKVYQSAHYLLTQSQGGWPLTVFLDPVTRIPFFSGTYFPKGPRYQLPGFVDLLTRITDVFSNKREALSEQGGQVLSALQAIERPDIEASIEATELLKQAASQLHKQFDPKEGGFSGAPKFPMPQTIQFLFRQWAYTNRKDKNLLDMVMTTLTKIARGGLYDHLGGGFYRYCVDDTWTVPHFEKMLYDNGQLLSLYADALALAPDELFSGVINETCHWLSNEMQHPAGGFYSALDADSEGEEGKYYVWRRGSVKNLLNEHEYSLIETLYGFDKPANFEGKWNLKRNDSWRSVIARLSLEAIAANTLLASAKSKLLSERQQRIRPHLDDKILTAWNGLVISGLAKVGTRLNEPRYVEAAEMAANFLLKHCWVDNKLYATWKNQPGQLGFLDDYANLLQGLLDLLSARWRGQYYDFALKLADRVIADFYDSDSDGFFFTGKSHEELIHRPKPSSDDAQPPGNAVLTVALATLGHLAARPDLLEIAETTFRWAQASIERFPAGHCSFLNFAQEQLHATEITIIHGDNAGSWYTAATQGYKPWRKVFAIPASEQILPDYLPTKTSDQPTAYICRALACSAPIQSLDEFKKQIGD